LKSVVGGEEEVEVERQTERWRRLALLVAQLKVQENTWIERREEEGQSECAAVMGQVSNAMRHLAQSHDAREQMHMG
jgi:hypothetical protein